MRTLVLALVMCAVIRTAEASCGSPSAGLSPPSGVLPVNPTIYVFLPTWDGKPDVEVKDSKYGHRLPYSVEEAGTTDAVHVFRVTIEADAETGGVTVDLGLTKGTYTISKTLPPNRAQVTGVTHVSDHWTCSFTEAIELALDGNAIAYRFVWDDHSSTTLMASQRTMWSDDAPGTRTTTQLGHLSCMGYDVDPKLLDRPRAFELYALFSDGSTQRLGSSTAQLGEHGVRLPTELVGAGAEAAARMIPGPSSVLYIETLPRWWSLALGAIGGLAVLALGAIAVRKSAHVPRA